MEVPIVISIIVPVFREKELILPCLKSILSQKIRPIEVLFIDDHGEDTTLTILQEALLQNHFVYENEKWIREGIDVYILQMPVNSGPGAARNVGIKSARGEYVAFIDADDWIDERMYATLYANAVQYGAQMSCCNAILDYEGSDKHKILANPRVGNGALTPEKKKFLLKNFISNYTTFLFNRIWLLNAQISFPTENSGEDSCFMACCYLAADSLVQTEEPFYHYIIRENSLSHKKFVRRGKQKRKAFSKMLHYARQQGFYDTYRRSLRWIYFKKAIVTPIVEWLKSII